VGFFLLDGEQEHGNEATLYLAERKDTDAYLRTRFPNGFRAPLLGERRGGLLRRVPAGQNSAGGRRGLPNLREHGCADSGSRVGEDTLSNSGIVVSSSSHLSRAKGARRRWGHPRVELL